MRYSYSYRAVPAAGRGQGFGMPRPVWSWVVLPLVVIGSFALLGLAGPHIGRVFRWMTSVIPAGAVAQPCCTMQQSAPAQPVVQYVPAPQPAPAAPQTPALQATCGSLPVMEAQADCMAKLYCLQNPGVCPKPD